MTDWIEMPKNENARSKTNTQKIALNMGYMGPLYYIYSTSMSTVVLSRHDEKGCGTEAL